MPFIQPIESIGAIATIHPKTSNIPFWSCLLWTPSLTLPPSSLKCWQKSNPNIYKQCFRCFKCFGCFRCFISLLDQKTARFLSKSELNPQTDRIVPPPYNAYGKHPKRQSTHLSTNTTLSWVLQAQFFSAKPTFCSLPYHPTPSLQTSPNQAAAIKNSRKWKNRG